MVFVNILLMAHKAVELEDDIKQSLYCYTAVNILTGCMITNLLNK